MRLFDRSAHLIAEQEVREVHSRALAQRVVAPCPGVDVEKLVPAVARIALVFQLDEPVIADGPEEPDRRLGEFADRDGLDVRARAAEVRRVLAATAHRHARDRLPPAEERAVRVLFPAASRNQFLDDDLAAADDLRGTAVDGGESGPGVGAPGFHAGDVEEVLLDGRLDDEGPVRVDAGQVRLASREPRPGYRDGQPCGQPVRLPFVPRMADRVHARHRHPEVAQQRLAVGGESRDGLVPGRVEHPPRGAQPVPRPRQRAEQRFLRSQIADADRRPHEPRRSGDRGFVVDDADGDAMPSEAPRDAQPLIITADNDSAYGLAVRSRYGTRQAATHLIRFGFRGACGNPRPGEGSYVRRGMSPAQRRARIPEPGRFSLILAG